MARSACARPPGKPALYWPGQAPPLDNADGTTSAGKLQFPLFLHAWPAMGGRGSPAEGWAGRALGRSCLWSTLRLLQFIHDYLGGGGGLGLAGGGLGGLGGAFGAGFDVLPTAEMVTCSVKAQHLHKGVSRCEGPCLAMHGNVLVPSCSFCVRKQERRTREQCT